MTDHPRKRSDSPWTSLRFWRYSGGVYPSIAPRPCYRQGDVFFAGIEDEGTEGHRRWSSASLVLPSFPSLSPFTQTRCQSLSTRLNTPPKGLRTSSSSQPAAFTCPPPPPPLLSYEDRPTDAQTGDIYLSIYLSIVAAKIFGHLTHH